MLWYPTGSPSPEQNPELMYLRTFAGCGHPFGPTLSKLQVPLNPCSSPSEVPSMTGEGRRINAQVPHEGRGDSDLPGAPSTITPHLPMALSHVLDRDPFWPLSLP